MILDDTDHTCMVSQSLIESGNNVEAFTTRFASRFRWWLLALPAGVGKATARSCIKLWLGANTLNSGAYSAGNGPAREPSREEQITYLELHLISVGQSISYFEITDEGRSAILSLHQSATKNGLPVIQFKNCIIVCNGSLLQGAGKGNEVRYTIRNQLASELDAR